MRRVGLAVAALMLAGCGGPPGDGGLWARQGLQQELALSRLSDGQRVAAAHAHELTLADETLSAEAARLAAALQDCPGTQRVPLTLSTANQVRDGVRARIGADPARQQRVADQALADWYIRRARATGASDRCALARAALQAAVVRGGTAADLGMATVTRTPNDPGPAIRASTAASSSLLLDEYALGWTDSVRAMSPLPEYIGAVYGGYVTTDAARSTANPEDSVDELAPAHPEWEPDALLAALTAR